MTLTDRANQARDALFGRYDQLNALWLQAEEELTKAHIPRLVSCAYLKYEEDYQHPDSEVHHCLGIQKINGKWKICHAIYCPYLADPCSEPTWTPITECSAEIRVLAAKHLPQLREAVVESAETFIPKVDEAINALREAIRPAPSDQIRSLLAERAKLNGKAK
jgi:hypothetical protein